MCPLQGVILLHLSTDDPRVSIAGLLPVVFQVPRPEQFLWVLLPCFGVPQVLLIEAVRAVSELLFPSTLQKITRPHK